MEKRIHSKQAHNPTLCHYLLHFKWLLLGFLFALNFLVLAKINLAPTSLPYVIQKEQIESFNNVIYPIDVLNHSKITTSINYYFLKKDELKRIDDTNAVYRNQKIILPLVKNSSTSNSYLILEFTNVFGRPRFCSHTREQIFGKNCPYTNW